CFKVFFLRRPPPLFSGGFPAPPPPPLRFRRLRCSRHIATKPGDETRRRSVFGFRGIRKLAWRRRKISNDSAPAAIFFPPADSSVPVPRDRRKGLRQFPRSENHAPFARPGPVLQKRDRAQACRE